MADPATASLALGGAGLVKDFMGQQDANKQRNQALSLEEQKFQMDKERADRLRAQFDKVQKLVDEARMKGVYDPNKWAENYAKEFHKGAETIQNQNFVNLTGGGYKPTDSEFKYKTDRLDRTLAHDLAVGEGRAREAAVGAEVNALNAPNANFLQTPDPSRLSSIYMQGAKDSTPDWGKTISSILPLLNWGKNKGGYTGGDYVDRDTGERYGHR